MILDRKNKNIIYTALSLILIFLLFIAFAAISCKAGQEKISGEVLSKELKQLDDEVKVSREKVEEFEKLEDVNFLNISPQQILDLMSLDFKYSATENETQDSYKMLADFIDGRKILIAEFKEPGKVDSFYLQFQSNLYRQGFIYNQRLRYQDICNEFINEEESLKAYLLKRENYFITLFK